MRPDISFDAGPGDGPPQMLWEDNEHALYRGQRTGKNKAPQSVLALRLTAERPRSASADRLAHEYGLKDHLESAWAVRPLELVPDRDRVMLVLEDPGGMPLERYLGEPIEASRFLQLAIGITAAVGQVHQRGFVHKDLKPAHVLVHETDARVRLTGFGLASRLPRERQAPGPPEFIAGTLAYMAPEQTGRMNRSIDSRSDLYALGVIFYQMLTGVLPFAASDPMEWVHSHIARTPVPPHERVRNIPTQISQIVTKLLAKTAEERYQSAAGVERDLRRCAADWQAKGSISTFPAGEMDAPDRLSIPERLYGRAGEIATLLAAFDRVVAGGRPELVLVSGYSGIGKSAVVNELHKPLVPPRGLFAMGKFDQYKRDIPYATLAQAFQGLTRPLLSKSEEELSKWRGALHEALDPNGQLMVALVPELTAIIGEQPPVPELPRRESQARFQSVFREFISVFARPEHPLALFLDDLQWLDEATLDLVEYLLTQPDTKHLLLIGAYRDNEVGPAHPLARKLQAMRQAGAPLQDIMLAPLTREDLERLVTDSLHCEPGYARSLAELVHDKTGGNPFFTIQFVSALFEESLLSFDHVTGRWSWDFNRIHAKGYTDNVVDLMVRKLTRLPPETQNALKQLACLGNTAQFAVLSLVYQDSIEEMHAQLREALESGFILWSSDSYRFLHDRVQEAAYSLIPQEGRAEAHLRIGRLMVSHIPADEREEAIFEIVNQLNRGRHLIAPVAERERIAELNLMAGRRAKLATAYSSALTYLRAGRDLLTDETWIHNYDLIFSVEYLLAECEFLTADMAAAENRLSVLVERAKSAHDIALITRLRVTLYTTMDRSDRAVEVFIEYWRGRGTAWAAHPTQEEVVREYERVWSLLGNRQIEELLDLPLISNPDALDFLDVFTEVVTPALYTDQAFLALVLCRMVSLSLEHGNCDGSCYAYVWLGVLAGPYFGDYQVGFRFGQLGYDLVEQRGFHRYQARTCMCFGCLIIPWTKHVRTGRDLIRRCFNAANRIGDLTYAAYSCIALNTNLLAAGDPLPEVQREAETGLEFATNVRFDLAIDCITAQLALVRTLRGLTAKFGTFNDERFDELRFERDLASAPASALQECWYWIRKLQARFFAGDYSSAIEASQNAERLLWTSPSFFDVAEYHFYSALSRAAAYDSAANKLRQLLFEAVVAHQKQLDIWVQHCPENFQNRAALVGAEIARIEGRDIDAMRLYERAIDSAHANDFVHNEALANELAGRFYAARGFKKIANTYLKEARYRYLHWGAEGKVWQLDAMHPELRTEEPASKSTIAAPVEHLDLATVIKVSQAVSGEIVLEKLLDTLMHTAIEQAGAERGLLVLLHEGAQRLAAEATTKDDVAAVALRDEPVSAAALPESVLYYVLRTRESVILDDASRSVFATDPYIRRHQARSVLCLPLLNQANVIGVLLLENNLAPRVFAPARIAVLKLLASQAAISLENSRLYRDLAGREAEIRRLVDANIIGTFIWKATGASLEFDDIVLTDANDAFLRMVGYDRTDLAAGRLSRFTLTPPELHDRDAPNLTDVKNSGTTLPFEKEYVRKDGSRVSVLMGLAAFGDQRDQGVSFVVDLTERKRAEAEVREAQMALAHASRVAALGQLSASIGHEVSQPLSGIVTNAETGLLWLQSEPPNLPEAVGAFSRVVRDGRRASAIVNRIRALARKAPPQKDRLDISEIVQEVVSLARSEVAKDGALLQTELREKLPPIQGDRVQLQQVILNLVMNAVEAMRSCEAGPKEILVQTAQTESGDILVSVRDTGPGIDQANVERMFNAFFTTKSGGLGLGLSICRSIIEALGGKLWAIPSVSRGAVFKFTLPVAPR